MKRLSFGIIGAGGIARRKTIPGMLKARNCRPLAVMDVVGVDEIARQFNVPRAYATEKELVADPDVQAVYIASPVHLHLRHIRLAADAGKHILCEKPLTLNSRQAAQAVRACKANQVFLQEGYMMKFHGAHQRIRELIADGRLGTIVYMRAQLACWYPPIKGAWRQDPRTGGGGALIDMATHLYDLLEYLSGQQIKRVAAITGRQVQKYKSEDSSTTLLEFDRGAHATVDAFFCVPDQASQTRLELYGSAGAILTEGTIGQGSGGKVQGILGLGQAGYDATQNKDVAAKFATIPFKKINPYTAQCAYFAECVLNRRPPKINDAANALHIMAVTDAAYASAKQRRTLTV